MQTLAKSYNNGALSYKSYQDGEYYIKYYKDNFTNINQTNIQHVDILPVSNDSQSVEVFDNIFNKTHREIINKIIRPRM